MAALGRAASQHVAMSTGSFGPNMSTVDAPRRQNAIVTKEAWPTHNLSLRRRTTVGCQLGMSPMFDISTHRFGERTNDMTTS